MAGKAGTRWLLSKFAAVRSALLVQAGDPTSRPVVRPVVPEAAE